YAGAAKAGTWRPRWPAGPTTRPTPSCRPPSAIPPCRFHLGLGLDLLVGRRQARLTELRGRRAHSGHAVPKCRGPETACYGRSGGVAVATRAPLPRRVRQGALREIPIPLRCAPWAPISLRSSALTAAPRSGTPGA